MIRSLQLRLSEQMDYGHQSSFFRCRWNTHYAGRRVGETYASLRKSTAWKFRHRDRRKIPTCFPSAPPFAFPGAPAAAIEELERDWWKELVRRVFEPWDRFRQFDEYFAELFAYFAQPKAWTLYPEVAETLSALEKRGIILSVISNFDSRLIGILEGLGDGTLVRAYFRLEPGWSCKTRATDFSHSPGTAQSESQ